jgi:hypothetical protein
MGGLPGMPRGLPGLPGQKTKFKKK